MQVRTYGAYWFNRPVVQPGALATETIDAYGEIIFDIGDDSIADSGGALDFIITPGGTSGNLNTVVYRQMTLENDAGQVFKIDVLYVNQAIDVATAQQVNNGAVIPLDSAQWNALPQDPTLRIVSFFDYTDPFVPASLFNLTFMGQDTPGDGFWWNNVTKGTFNTAEGDRSDFTIARDDQNVLVLTYGEDVDRIAGFERVGFADGFLAFDDDGVAGQAYRIYQAAFDRMPDPAGLGYWIDSMDSGVSLYSVAQGFLASAEFVDVYGASVSNETFISQLYRNILDRDGEAAGVTYWSDQLNSGAADRATVLVGFSESAENVARVGPAIEDGIWYS
jgi:hypothetical protein